jgi:hypothetical protein
VIQQEDILYVVTGSQTDVTADERYNARIICGEEVTPAEQYVVCFFMFLYFM